MFEKFFVKKLNQKLVEKGAVIRVIPTVITHIVEASHKEQYPDGKIMYLDEYKREMLVVEETPKMAGKIAVVYEKSASSMVSFNNCKYYDSFEEAITDMLLN